jgi:hypothetical protein
VDEHPIIYWNMVRLYLIVCFWSMWYCMIPFVNAESLLVKHFFRNKHSRSD